jgi:lipopolysaccharide heptosyltransferase I
MPSQSESEASSRPYFLIVRLSSIGDVVHTLPALVALKKRYPHARIDWLVESRFREVLLDNPWVDRLVEVDTLGFRRAPISLRSWRDLLRSVGELRRVRYDAVLDLQGTLKSAVCSRLTRTQRRIGFATSELKERAAALLYSERVGNNGAGPHVIDRNLHLLSALGIETRERAFPITVPETVEDRAMRTLGSFPLGSGYVVLNPGGSWPTKRWSPKRFGELAAAISRELGLSSLVIWGPNERALADEIVRTAGGAAHLAPETKLRDMMALIKRARLFVSGDTGPLHIASAFSVPSVAIFGPTDPARNGPFLDGDEVVGKTVPCGPCYKQRCPGYDNVCMTEIEVSDVMSAVRKRLGVDA